MMRFEVCLIVIRGRKPSWITCWVTENAPEITACEAITVATVASTTIAFWPVWPPGTSRKNGFTIVFGWARIRAPWPM